MPEPHLNYEQAAHRHQSCIALGDQLRNELLLGENRQTAVPGINPNRVTVDYLEPIVVELQRVTRQMEEIVAEWGEPGDNWIGEWYWSGVDDLKRLRARVNYYRASLDHARSLGATEQRIFLYENVLLPILFGTRHKNVADRDSPWIHTLSDFCEPARIFKNYVYSVNLNEAQTGLGVFLGDMWDVIVDFFEVMAEIGAAIAAGGAAVGKGVKEAAKFAKKAALPVGILLAGIGIFLVARKMKAAPAAAAGGGEG